MSHKQTNKVQVFFLEEIPAPGLTAELPNSLKYHASLYSKSVLRAIFLQFFCSVLSYIFIFI